MTIQALPGANGPLPNGPLIVITIMIIIIIKLVVKIIL